MKVLYVTSEALPFAASGGLADVAGSLPQALRPAADRLPGGARPCTKRARRSCGTR